ncbi:IS630 family transposase [Jatrophihabitans sp. GAS493]|uniref:IS630 family transposase n=1 Tax=Jatrophihabitans sp. GAS493 TaxID=1907575 RepID=UPI0018D531CC
MTVTTGGGGDIARVNIHLRIDFSFTYLGQTWTVWVKRGVLATGKITGTCQPQHRHQEFLRFLKQVAKAYPDQELHLVMDNYAAHKRVEIRDWLTANPRITVHFTPTSASWMNLVEVWFGIIERQAIHRGTSGSVSDLTTKIRAFINGWNDRSHPFAWTKTADQILTKANRQTTSKTGH